MLYAVHMRAAARLLCARLRQQKTVQLFLFNYYLAAAVSRPNGAAMQCMNTGLEATTLHQVVTNWSPTGHHLGTQLDCLGSWGLYQTIWGPYLTIWDHLGTLPDHLGTLLDHLVTIPDNLGPYQTIWGPYQTIWGSYQTI